MAKCAERKIGFLFRLIFHASAVSHPVQDPNPPLSRIQFASVERGLQATVDAIQKRAIRLIDDRPLPSPSTQ